MFVRGGRAALPYVCGVWPLAFDLVVSDGFFFSSSAPALGERENSESYLCAILQFSDINGYTAYLQAPEGAWPPAGTRRATLKSVGPQLFSGLTGGAEVDP